MPTDQEIYQKALTKWGVDNQLKKLSQELLELGLALAYMEEGRSDHNVAEELADVQIMLNQIKPLFNENNEVNNWHEMKIKRLNERINK